MYPLSLAYHSRKKKRIMATQENNIQAILTKYAKSDLSKAKKYGQVAICGTQKGNVEIEYNFETKLFHAANFNNTNIKLTGPIAAKEMTAFIAGIYVVEN